MIDDGVTMISNSWAYCEDQTTQADVQSIDSILATAAASGIRVLNASGDNGGTCLDGSPNTCGAGRLPPCDRGRRHQLSRSGDNPAGETWWNGAERPPAHRQGGFGTKRLFRSPRLSERVSPLSHALGTRRRFQFGSRPGGRDLPGLRGGCPAPSPGAAPASPRRLGAGDALPHQALGQNLGHLNPTLYPLATSGRVSPAGEPGQRLRARRAGVREVQCPPARQSKGLLPGSGERQRFGDESALRRERNPGGPSRRRYGRRLVARWPPETRCAARRWSSKLTESSAVITPPSGVSNEANGAVVFEVTDGTIEDVTLTATDTTDGIELDPDSDDSPRHPGRSVRRHQALPSDSCRPTACRPPPSR